LPNLNIDCAAVRILIALRRDLLKTVRKEKIGLTIHEMKNRVVGIDLNRMARRPARNRISSWEYI
jgi:hypothetical protein